MIKTRQQLNHYLKIEKEMYLGHLSGFRYVLAVLTGSNCYIIWKFVKSLRKCEFYYNKGGAYRILLLFERIRKNRLGRMMGIEIYENCFEEGLLIYHGNVVVNPLVKGGKNIKFHGSNCIGNLGAVPSKCPIIGDNVDFGFGSSAFGDIVIPSATIIGANATVLSTPTEKHTYLVGTPAIGKD